MLWRGWCFISGTPTGALAALALLAEPGAAALAIGAVAGGIAFAGAASWIARRRDDDPARGPHLATAASSGWVALPGCGMALLGLAPGAAGLLAVVTVLVAVALARGARRQGPVDARRRLLGGLVEPVAGAIALVATSAALASLGAATPVQSEARAAAVYDLDAQVVTRELPFCAQRVASWRVLLDRGAHPRWSADGVALWFDARDDAGARQVYRLRPSADEAEPVCWTCGQPGNNARPAPGPLGGLVVFDSDREATWLHPSNTELYRMGARGDGPGAVRRLTYEPGPDDHALIGPSANLLAWSSQREGRYAVVSATIVSGHGGALLRNPGVAYAGGARWAAPLAWSRDARHLVVVRGNPYAPLAAVAIDPATGASRLLAESVSGHGAVGFSDDGGWLALAHTRRAGPAGLLPGALGFLLGPFATRAELFSPLFREAELFSGASQGPLEPIAIDEIASWGGSTGVGLSPDGARLVVGQRRRGDGGIEERLVHVDLECAPG